MLDSCTNCKNRLFSQAVSLFSLQFTMGKTWLPPSTSTPPSSHHVLSVINYGILSALNGTNFVWTLSSLICLSCPLCPFSLFLMWNKCHKRSTSLSCYCICPLGVSALLLSPFFNCKLGKESWNNFCVKFCGMLMVSIMYMFI